MAIPEEVFSTDIVDANFLGGRSLPVSETVDYETGGYAIQDPSRGLLCNIWRARVIEGMTKVVMGARPSSTSGQIVGDAEIMSGANISEISISFDRNMNPVLAYVESGTPKLYWYDSSVPGFVVTNFPGVITPRVSLDDKRDLQSQVSDVIFAYMREEGGQNRIFYRQQRDRYTIEYDPTEDLAPAVRDEYRAMVDESPGLIKIGMNRQLRMQFMFRNPT